MKTNKQARALVTKLITLRKWLANLKTVGQFDRLETQGRADVAAQVQRLPFGRILPGSGEVSLVLDRLIG